tara:strand:- start:249 stop:365 length:117 start_codon:yes stop_codon:yes gene_type:complete
MPTLAKLFSFALMHGQFPDVYGVSLTIAISANYGGKDE